MDPRRAIAALLLLQSCAVLSPVPYAGDTAYENAPLVPVWDPEGASYQQPPPPAARLARPQRQAEPSEDALTEEDMKEYDYFYLHTQEGIKLLKRPKPFR